MILNSQAKQLRLQDDGQILWQVDPTNPLPGKPVARICKGKAQLSPDVDLLETDALGGQDKDAVRVFIKAWLDQHIATVLEKLVALTRDDALAAAAAPVREIATQLHEALGVIPRQDIETHIAGLDSDGRRALRQHHIRLGPVLIFIPELNKPAAVRLRALLWWLWKDRPLPAPVPKDGAVSFIVDESQIDPFYYRAIGYPVYGGRAIRIDMLDRVISAIYDSAKDGTFKASHAMAEWLGCSIPDLYRVLEAMGHRKAYDPAEQPPASEPEPEPASAPAPVAEVPVDISALPATAESLISLATDDDKAPVATLPLPAKKPELATFRLKKGRASQAGSPPREHHAGAPRHRDSRDKDKRADKNPPSRVRERKEKRGHVREERRPASFEALPSKIEDSPFAILQQMRSGMKDQ